MSCCDKRSEVTSASESTAPFKDMESAESYAEHFASCYRCKRCGQLWVVDAWDKYARLAAFKVEEIPGKDEVAGMLLRAHEQLALKDAGGVAEGECLWSGCTNKAIKGMWVCFEHSGA